MGKYDNITPRPMNCIDCKRRFTPSTVSGFVRLCDPCRKRKSKKKG